MTHLSLALAAGVLVSAVAATSASALDPTTACLAGRHRAAAKYLACQQKAKAARYVHPDLSRFSVLVSKCQAKYASAWTKLAAKAAGTGNACDGNRFVDNGDYTVNDRLTGLQWEQKTDDGGIHDKDNAYSWGATLDNENGTAFTTLLAAFNTTPCLGNQCGWRLPTLEELVTILAAPYECHVMPCIDETPFGPTAPLPYWSSMVTVVTNDAWVVSFATGGVVYFDKHSTNPVRAVRGGL